MIEHSSQDPESQTAHIGEIEADGQPANTTSDGYDQLVMDTILSDSGAHDLPTARSSTLDLNDGHDVEQARAVAANRLPAGYSKHTTGVVYYGGIREDDQAKLRFVQSLPLREQVIELHRLFFDRTEAVAYFRDKSIKQEEEMETGFCC